MINGFQAKKLNTSGELELAANRTEPQNQAVHHVKGRPTASTYFQEKGVLILTLITPHPVVSPQISNSLLMVKSSF